MSAQLLNSNTYFLTASTSSAPITLTDDDANSSTLTNFIIQNTGLVPVFCVSGLSSAPTAVYPTSDSTPVAGKVVPAGAIVTYKRSTGHKYLSIISESSTAKVAVSVGYGD